MQEYIACTFSVMTSRGMLPQRILKIKGLRLAENAFLAPEIMYDSEALSRCFPTFDTCNVKLFKD